MAGPKSPLPKPADVAGGMMFTAPMSKSAYPSKGESPKSSMVDGPYGGKKPA
jgi:hypothetical protein